MPTVDIYIDRINKKLIADTNGGTAAALSIFQADQPDFRVFVCDPKTDSVGFGGAKTYSLVDCSGSGLRMAVGATPTGTAGGPTPAITFTSWVWDSTNKCFTGTINFDVAAIATLIGTASYYDATIEFKLTSAGKPTTIYQGAVRLYANLDEGTATVAPVGGDRYYTAAEVDSILSAFVKFIGNLPGQSITLRNAEDTNSVVLDCDTNGSLRASNQ